MFQTRLSKNDLEKYYFKGLTQDKAKNLLRDGKDCYKPDAWDALVKKARELGVSLDDIEYLKKKSIIDHQIQVKRRPRWFPISLILLIGLVFVGLGIGLKFGTGLMVVFMVFLMAFFAWLIITDRY